MQSNPKRDNQPFDMVWNALSVLMLLGIGMIVAAFVIIFNDPASRLNPLPLPTAPVALVFPTLTPYHTPVPPTPPPPDTATPNATVTPVEPTPTIPLTPTEAETPTPGPSPTPTINSLYSFILRGDPVAIAGSAMPGHEECKLWVAGQAYDLQNAPMTGITVQLGGYLGRTISQYSLTGTALQYGPAGYEFTVSNTVQASSQSVWIMLLDQSGVPLSGRVYFDTFNDCQKNLILINFRQVR
jgi:hypothetical protein